MLIIYSNSDIKVSSEILDVYLSFIKFIIGKGHSHTQVVPNIYKSLLITDLSMF